MEIRLPRMFSIRQNFPATASLDIPQIVRSKLKAQSGLPSLKGLSIAIGVGSRGIENLAGIISCLVAWLTEQGARPFIVPAMGSHGGATSEGQAEVLATYGITETGVGAPVNASMEVELLGRTEDNVEVYFSAAARHADALIVVNRVKPHTDFAGKVGSGLMKMLAVGLGKRVGAGTCHRAASRLGHERVIRGVARTILSNVKVLFGIAILEDQLHQTAKIELVSPADFEAREEVLYAEAKALMPRLPFGDIDLLIVDRIGKNITGAGMDPNVIGRSVRGYSSFSGNGNHDYPQIECIFVRDLTPETHGNAVGVGLADMTTSRVVRALDPSSTYVNVLTARTPQTAKIPMHFERDRDAVEHALGFLFGGDPGSEKVVRISDTLSLERVEVSEAYLEQARQRGDLTLISDPRDMQFDSSGNLLPMQS